MAFFAPFIKGRTLEAPRTSYDIAKISAVDVNRPLLIPGIGGGALTGAFLWSFGDILTPAEILTGLVVASLALGLGLTVGQMRLVSRDLRGTRLADRIIGFYPALNRLRPEILHVASRSASEGRS